MFSHIMVGSNDIERSRRFYDALFAAIDAGPGVIDEWGRLFYAHAGARFGIRLPINGEPAVAGNGPTIGFQMNSPAQTDAWHAAGVAHGGTTIEDPPGIRKATGGRTVYLAYLRDPDGNKLCGFHKVSG